MNDVRINALEAAVENGTASGDFPTSLIQQFNRRGSLSEKQWHWVVKLAQPQPEPTTVDVGSFEGVIALFERAAQHLKFPKIRLGFGGPTGFANNLRLSRAGAQSRYEGQIQLTDGGPYGDNIWYGRVSTDGQITLSRWFDSQDSAVRDAFIVTLRRLADEPEVVAADYGKYSGNCCFCAKPIGEGDDRRSAEVGYGGTCAKNYGMPWGEK